MSTELRASTSQQRPEIIRAVALYKPFITGLLVVIAASYLFGLVLTSHGTVSMHRLMNIFMGCFFLVFSLPKFVNLANFVSTFKQYDLISQKLTYYAWAYPFIEFGLGLVLVRNYFVTSVGGALLINVLVAIITGLGMISVRRALRQNKKLDCACLGSAFRFPLSRVTLAENGLMFVMALSMLITLHTMTSMASLIQFGIPL